MAGLPDRPMIRRATGNEAKYQAAVQEVLASMGLR